MQGLDPGGQFFLLHQGLPEPRATTRAEHVGQDVKRDGVAMLARHGMPAEQPAWQDVGLQQREITPARLAGLIPGSLARETFACLDRGKRLGDPVHRRAGSTSPASTRTAPSGR